MIFILSIVVISDFPVITLAKQKSKIRSLSLVNRDVLNLSFLATRNIDSFLLSKTFIFMKFAEGEGKNGRKE